MLLHVKNKEVAVEDEENGEGEEREGYAVSGAIKPSLRAWGYVVHR
jgi:hypothetical protein